MAGNQKFYLRLAYTTDVPVSIWARPYFHGKQMFAGSNPSGKYNGSGEALGWFFLEQRGDEVDEIRIVAGDAGSGAPVVATYRVHVLRGSDHVVVEAEPGWLVDLRASSQAAFEKAYRAQQKE
ncbi:hypothetical protein [Dokdonella soli]|uniref:hypothetical protein n=1 Tax=Dokdonella soli TaxID=529810 RepID=UPI0036D3AF4C